MASSCVSPFLAESKLAPGDLHITHPLAALRDQVWSRLINVEQFIRSQQNMRILLPAVLAASDKSQTEPDLFIGRRAAVKQPIRQIDPLIIGCQSGVGNLGHQSLSQGARLLDHKGAIEY